MVDNIASLVLFHRYGFLETQYLFTAIFTLEFNLKDKLTVDVHDFRNVFSPPPPTFKKEKENSKAGAKYCLSVRERFQGEKRLATLISRTLSSHRMVMLKHFR